MTYAVRSAIFWISALVGISVTVAVTRAPGQDLAQGYVPSVGYVLSVEDIEAGDDKPFLFGWGMHPHIFETMAECKGFLAAGSFDSANAELRANVGPSYRLGEPTCIAWPRGLPINLNVPFAGNLTGL